MYNTIIVPTNLSDEENTIKSLKKAKELSNNNRVIMLHVLDLIPSYALAELPIDLIEGIVPKIQEKMKRIGERSEVEVKIEVRHGRPYSKIIQSAEENKAGLILINSNEPGLQGYLLGSTASKVVRHAKCTVLVER
ncbi:MAG: universal stress protein F [Cocleimonas sp.]|jgi:universal stress protein F